MKFTPTLITYFLRNRSSQRNLGMLLRFFMAFIGIVTAYSVMFHYLMAHEGHEYSWITGIYWTLTVMSTLGFGDITFSTDLGLLFSIVVLLTGTTFMLVLFPFLFIQFFYAPWMEAQEAARTPLRIPEDTTGHIIITNYDPVTAALINKLIHYKYPYVLIAPTAEDTLQLQDRGLNVVFGDLDAAETYRRVQVEQAAMVVATSKDEVNAHVAFTVRELTKDAPIVATATDSGSVDILQLAGCTHVFQLGEMLGKALDRRTIAGDAMAHVIGEFDNLLIAEATAHNTPLVGKTLRDSKIRELVDVNVVGIWEHGQFNTPNPDLVFSQNSFLVLAGTEEQLDSYNELFCIYNATSKPVVIIGGGRVGRAAGRALDERGVDYRIVEKLPERIRDPEKYILGSAAEIEVLEAAGIKDAPSVIITPHNDDITIYLTIYCRRLRPDIQIISRAMLERNVGSLHRAGADAVMSYASMGASAMFNILKRSEVLLFTEGLDFFRRKVPPALAGKTLAEADIRKKTGCTVIAVQIKGTNDINPDPHEPLPTDGELILVGNETAEESFLKTYAAE